MILEINIDCSVLQLNPLRYDKTVLTLTTDRIINFTTEGPFTWEGSVCGIKVLINQENIHTDPNKDDIFLPVGLSLDKRILAARIKDIVKRQTS